MAAETPPTLSNLTQTHADADQPSTHDASSQVILDPAQEDEFLTALEAEDFETALQIVPKSDLSLLTVEPDNLSLLRYACQHGRDKLLRVLITKLDYNSDLDSEGGLTPLHVAAKEGHLEIVNLLVQHETSSIQRKQVADSALLEAGVPSKMPVTTTSDDSGNTPLHIAAAHGHLAVVKFLIDEAQYSPVTANKDGHSPLHIASLYGHLSVVKYFVGAKELSPSPRDEQGRTPLYLAAGTGQLDVVRYLISNMQCDPVIRTTERWKTDEFNFAPGRMPLHTASREGHLNVVQYLVSECGCDVMHRDDDGTTALHLASQQGHLNVIKYLIDEQQADPSCLDGEDHTPLHFASLNGHITVVRFLSEEKGCDPLCRNKYDNTPLHSASLNGSLEVVKFFITEKHCDPMCRGQWGTTPLHQACENGHLDVVKYLIDEQQADPSCLDEEDRATPLHLASLNGHITVVRFLSEEKGCDPLCRDKYDDTPLHYASSNGSLEVVKFFITEKHCDPMCRGQLGRTPLHQACQIGHIDVVKYLIDEQQADPLCLDGEDHTPLHFTSLNGHITVVRFLSEEKGCDPLCRNKYDNTPLHSASLNGSLEVVKFFITEKHCDPMCRGQWGTTPLHQACENGHLDVVKYLIDEQQADPSCLDEEDRSTPLHLASLNGHITVVRFLSEEKGCDPLCRDKYDDTPLHDASSNGSLEVVKFFITEKHCDPMCRGQWGTTPLHQACQNGHLDVVKYLIDEQQADPSCLDEEDRATPLHLASKNGHITVVRFLSEEKGCDPLCRNKRDNTPLHRASSNGRLEVVKFFITEKHCDPMCRGQRGRAPLHQACQNGHLDVVKYLIDEQQADPSCLDEEDRATPLHLASKNGHITVVRFLSEEKGCDPLCRNKYDNTPLHGASSNGRLEVVKFFITEKHCDPMCRGQRGRAPLHQACQNGHLDVVKYLIDEQQADPSCLDEEDRATPLHLASKNGHITVVRFLSEEKGCDPLCRNKYDNTPLHGASSNGRLEVVKFFITEKHCDPMCRGLLGLTPLHLSCYNGHLDVVKYLIDEQQADPSCLDEEDRATPLHLASENGHITVVRFLSEEKGCDPLCRDKYDDTPLHYASSNGSLEVVKFFITEKHCDPMCRGQWGTTPLHHACQNGHLDVVKYLLSKGGSTEAKVFPEIKTLKSWCPLRPFVKIFVTGNSGSGKSTLVKALQNEASLMGWFFNVSSVPPETAGIIPKEFVSKLFGEVIIYDLAGHEEYHASHELVFESVSHAIVLVTVDLRKSTDKLKRELAYWQLLVTKAGSGAKCLMHVIPVGSHADTLSTQEVEAKTTFLSEAMQSLSQFQALQYKKWIMLDCRKSSSGGMSSLREVLVQSCKSMRIQADFDYINGSYLNAFITEHLTHATACTFSHLLSQIHQSQNADFDSLKSHSILFGTCESLNTSGHLMFLKNEGNATESWIIFKKEEILSTVHGLLNYLKLSNKTGVLALSQLENALKNNDKHFSIDLAIRYMKQMILCVEIDLEALIQIDGFETTSLLKEERYFFFPTLISEQQHTCTDTWKFSKECYLTGWCLTCTEPWHFFTPRFLQLLLISLARHFALVPQPQGSRTLLELSPGCKLWKNGIRWLDADGIETVVEVTEQSTNVIVAMRCLKGKEMSCIKHRSSVIQQVLQIKDKFCSGITPKEHLLHPHCLKTYPTQILSQIPMLQVAKSILHKNQFVLLDDDTPSQTPFLPVEELLYFEPYHCLGIDLLKEIFNPQCRDESAVPEKLIQNMSKCMVEKWQHLACILQVSPFEVEHDCDSHDTIQKCRKTLALWKESSSGTFGSLRRNLSHYSIFAGRNPLELYPELITVAAAVKPDSVATDGTIATDDSAQVDESVLADPRSAADISAADAVDQQLSVQDRELDDSDHSEISNYLFPLVKENMYSLGRVMGLNYTKLRHMMDSAPVTFNDDVIAAWLRREDDVLSRGAPSWKSLVTALRHPTIGQNGIAHTIANDKGLTCS